MKQGEFCGDVSRGKRKKSGLLRRLLTADSTYCNVVGQIPFDLSGGGGGLALPGSTPIRIILTHRFVSPPPARLPHSRFPTFRANPERLVSPDNTADYILDISKIALQVTYVTLSQPSLLSLRHRLGSGSLALPFLRNSLIGPLTVPQGTRETQIAVTQGKVPELLLFGFAPTKYSESAYKRNFLAFQPCGVSFLQAMVLFLLDFISA